MHQDGDGIDREELRNPQLVPIDPDLVHLQVNFRHLHPLIPEVEPHIRGLPVVDRIDGVGASDALCSHVQSSHVLKALDRLGRPDAGDHNTVAGYPWEKGLIVVHPRPELWVVANSKGRGLAYPDIPFAPVPANKGFVAG